MNQAVSDLGAAMNAIAVMAGERLGLYKAMVSSGPVTPAQLAGLTGTNPRYIREWLCSQAAGGYVIYDPSTETFELPAEQALALGVENSPVYFPGAYEVVSSLFADQEVLFEILRTGQGLGWHQHSPGLFCGTERFFRPNYIANLLSSWIPALDGVEDKLRAGASVADIGCGHGASTILMAKAFPKSHFFGFDYHGPSIERARAAAQAEELGHRIQFEVASAKDFHTGAPYDLVAFFDSLHDMGDPSGAAAHVRSQLAADGTWMIVEPYASDTVEENLNPVGRIFYTASTFVCTPASRAQEVGACLGAQAGPAKLTEVIRNGGFSRIRRAAETPFNMVLEARL